jgi:hypothetical protein
LSALVPVDHFDVLDVLAGKLWGWIPCFYTFFGVDEPSKKTNVFAKLA